MVNKSIYRPLITGAFFITLAVALSFSFSVAHAATCTPPTPPVCYVTVIVPPGEIDGVVVPTTKQVIGPSDSCSQSEYISEQADYISCLAVSKAASTPTSLSDLVGQSAANNLNCMKQFGSWSTYDENSHSCVDTKQSELNLMCTYDSVLGPNSQYDSSKDKCACQSGYTMQYNSSLNKERCVQSTAWCSNQHGVHASIVVYNQENYCGCDDGYDFDSSGQCVINAAPTPLPTVSTSTSKITAPTIQPNKSTAVTPKISAPQTFASKGSLISTTSTQSSTTPGMTPAEAQAWIYRTTTTTPKQMHWYEWLNPINWFSWLH